MIGSDQVICPHCRNSVPYHANSCPVCGTDVGYPNVRAAETPQEREALDRRYVDARTDASARHSALVLDMFEGAVFRSKAVLCRNWGVVNTLVSDDNELYATFHQRVWGESLLPSLNRFDQARAAVDAMFFPQYFEHIRFAALSLDDRGPGAYGACSIVLKELTISKRASVFEENTFLFCQKRGLVVGSQPPCGYRASWRERHRLAVAKLHRNLNATTRPDAFARILLMQTADTGKDDFIEVHIYGPLHRKSIERIIGPPPNSEEDEILVRSIRRKLAEVGAAIEIRS